MKTLQREDLLRKVLPLFFCIASALASSGCRVQKAPAGEPLVFEGRDGFPLHGTLYAPAQTEPPGLVLLHMLGSDRRAWAPFAADAVRRGYMVLAYDLRGHGESTTMPEGRITFHDMSAADWRAAVGDVGKAKEALVEAGADPENIGLAGASIGANLALLHAQRDPQIQAVVLLSPGADYRGLEALPAMEDFRRRPVLIMAAEGDSYSSQTARRMKAVARDFCELRIYPGTAHGTDLLAAARDAAGQVFLWLDQIFEPDRSSG